MAIKFEKLAAGDTLYSRRRVAGCIREWRVAIVSIDADARTAVVRWNSNAESLYTEKRLKKLYDWSMYDATVAQVVRLATTGNVIAVRKLLLREREGT